MHTFKGNTRPFIQYFAAAANLYGVIEIGKLLKIYNSQNEPVSEEDFLSFVEI